MSQDSNQIIEKKLDTVIGLLQHQLALSLSKEGASQEVIGKKLHIAKSAVVQMLKGIKKGNE